MRIPSSVTITKHTAPKPRNPGAPVRNPSEDVGFQNNGRPLNSSKAPVKKPEPTAPAAPAKPHRFGNGFDPARPELAFIPTGTLLPSGDAPRALLALAPTAGPQTGVRPTQAPFGGPRAGAGWAVAAALVAQG